MDKLNKLADKVDRAAEKIVNRIEDEIDNSQDKPIEPMSAAKQLLIGLPVGAVSGAVIGRASKPVAILVGTSVIVVTAANQFGFLDDFDRDALNRDARNARRQLDDELRQNNLPSTNQMRQIFKKNPTMTYAGIGSFLVAAAYYF